MKNYCDHHPLEPARWYCQDCQSFYCKTCTPGTIPTCPVCKTSLENLGSSNEVVPFWDRLPAFFKYPLSGHAPLIILFTMFAGIVFNETLSTGLLLLLALSVQTLYGFAALNRTADGELTAPTLGAMFEGNLVLLLKSILWFMGLGILAGSGFFLGEVWGMITVILAAFLYPASAIIYVHEGAVLPAINPLRLLDFVWKTRSGYVVLFIHLVLMLMASGAAEEAVNSLALPPFISMAIWSFIGSYFTIIIYSLSGYFLLQYQRELGLVATIDEEETEEINPLNRVKFWVKQGDYLNAISEMESLTRQQPANDEFKHYYWELLLQTQSFEKLAQHADSLSKRMLSTQRLNDLMLFIQYMLKERPNGFEELSTRMNLANGLIEAGHEKFAYALLKNVHQNYAYDPKRIDALLLLAQILKLLNQTAQAQKVAKYAFAQADNDQKLKIKERVQGFLNPQSA